MNIVERSAAGGGVVMKGPVRWFRGLAFALMTLLLAPVGILGTWVWGPLPTLPTVESIVCLVGCLTLAVLSWRYLQMSVTVDGSGLTVRNPFRVHRVPWSDVLALSTEWKVSFWDVVVHRRDGLRDVTVGTLTSVAQGLRKSHARAATKAHERAVRLTSFAPQAIVIEDPPRKVIEYMRYPGPWHP